MSRLNYYYNINKASNIQTLIMREYLIQQGTWTNVLNYSLIAAPCMGAFQTPPGVASSISALSHTFVEIDHEIISMVILLPSADAFKRVVVSYKQKYVHELLVNCLFKFAQEKVWLGELTVPP